MFFVTHQSWWCCCVSAFSHDHLLSSFCSSLLFCFSLNWCSLEPSLLPYGGPSRILHSDDKTVVLDVHGLENVLSINQIEPAGWLSWFKLWCLVFKQTLNIWDCWCGCLTFFFFPVLGQAKFFCICRCGSMDFFWLAGRLLSCWVREERCTAPSFEHSPVSMLCNVMLFMQSMFLLSLFVCYYAFPPFLEMYN